MNEEKSLVCSTGTMPAALGRRYHDLDAACRAAAAIPAAGLELVLHPDWRPNVPPRSEQPDPHTASPTFTVDDLTARIRDYRKHGGPRVRSLHANRDLGAFLGAANSADRTVGAAILRATVRLAHACGAHMVVVHLWDPRGERIHLREAAAILAEVTSPGETMHLSVENIPVSARDRTQVDIMYALDRLLPAHVGFTLDLSWSSLYDNFCALLRLLPRVTNVHVQGRLAPSGEEMRLRPRIGGLNLEAAIRELCRRGYERQWTLELNRPRSLTDFRTAVDHVSSVISW